MKKSILLVFLGILGMFLSEFLIWNISNFTVIYFTKGPLNAFVLIFLGALMYIILFSIGADIIYRFKIRDLTSLILLGSIYGLIVEGIFSDLLFRVGIGPVILGLSFSRIAFTTLSWHAVIDFCLGFIIFSRILKGESLLEHKKIKLKEILILILFSLFWFSWSYSGGLINSFPQGIPLEIQLYVLLFPMILIGIIMAISLNIKDYVPEKILGIIGYIICIGYLVIYSILRILALPNKILFLSFLLLIVFFIILFYAHLKYGRKESEISIIEESLPVKGSFNILKYVLVCLIIVGIYIVFKITAFFLHLSIMYYFFTMACFISSMVFVIVFPIYVILNIIIQKVKERIFRD